VDTSSTRADQLVHDDARDAGPNDARIAILRRLPRPTLHLFGRAFPAWSAASRVGAALGLGVWTALAWPLWGWAVVAAVAIANLASYRVVAALDSHRAGGRRLVLLHHLMASGVATALVALALDVPIAAVLDRWVVGLLVVLALGRLGCFFVGCCYGRISSWGTWYPFRALGPLRQAAGRAILLLPIQLMEAAGILALLGGALSLVLAGSPSGGALSLGTGGYAALRFACELGRGDPRPYWGALSQAQLESGLLLATALVASPVIGVMSLIPVAVTVLLFYRSFGEPKVFALRESSLAALRERCTDDSGLVHSPATPFGRLCAALLEVQVESTSSSSPRTSLISSTSDSTSSSSSRSPA
jgi:hypothetical protein